MNNPGYGPGDEEQEEDWVSRDKSGSCPKSTSNPSDTSEEGTGADGGNGTAGTEYGSVVSGAGSCVGTEVSGITNAADSADVEGGKCCHGNINAVKHGSAEEFSGPKEVP